MDLEHFSFFGNTSILLNPPTKNVIKVIINNWLVIEELTHITNRLRIDEMLNYTIIVFVKFLFVLECYNRLFFCFMVLLSFVFIDVSTCKKIGRGVVFLFVMILIS